VVEILDQAKEKLNAFALDLPGDRINRVMLPVAAMGLSQRLADLPGDRINRVMLQGQPAIEIEQ
jgi:hypothetical protein